MEGGETERKGEREMDQPSPRHDSLIRQRRVCARQREQEKKAKRERKLFCQDLRVLYHYPARLCLSSSSLSFSLSLSLSLVSSALLSSRLMEQSMQIARVNRARDRRGGGEGDNGSIQRLSSAPPISYQTS